METRHKQTKEVKAILSGAGYDDTVPKYVSNPDLAKANKSHQVLSGYQPATLEASRVVEAKEPEGHKKHINGWRDHQPYVWPDGKEYEIPYEKRRAFATEALDVDVVIDPDRQNRIYGKP